MGRVAPRFGVGGPAAASLLINALLIAALFNLGLGRDGRRTITPSLTVMSLALAKGVQDGDEEAEAAAPSAPTTTAASSAESVPDQPRLPAVEPTTPPMLTVPSILPMPVQAMAAVTPGSATTRSMASAQQTAPVTAPAVSTVRRGAVDGLDAKAPPGASRSYAAKVRSWLYAHKIYPRRARMRREEGVVRVRFVIDRTGVLIEGAIIHGSGHGTLDEEATAMMYRASPFPSVPNDVPGERIEFTAPIEFVLPA
ncbi:MAG: energy transducer TonB [Sphingobium sp.]|uniref:energy transducer TonB n=1 Tax=Sphingobium sp. TaxID=1912891 RepID=UPI00299FB3E2|nr:energy transducer TonB [Sphingobium sp.]MDX3910414.1 energy transducer TonB [Sphingobium sp.]